VADRAARAVPEPALRHGQPESVLRTVGVGHRYRRGRDVLPVLDDVSITLDRDRFASIIGPSGCGKSTLLRLIAGLDTPTAGWVELEGLTPAEYRRRALLGMVFQDAKLLPWRSVLRNVALPLELCGRPRGEARERSAEVLRVVGLEGFESYYPHQLSGGMRQRVAIGRALSLRPHLLLMDEPFGALDLISRDRMAKELLRIWSASSEMSILLVTHSVQEALLLSDRVFVFSARPGRLLREIEVRFPRPRDRAVRGTREFVETEEELRALLEAAVGN
jgi:NitT/TauT family transport system ATP-binding protein